MLSYSVVHHHTTTEQDMNLQAVLTLYDQEQRCDIEYPDARREAAPPVIRGIDLFGYRSFINYSHLEGQDVDRVIDEQIRYFESLGHDFEWKVFSHDFPQDLSERLRARGFDVEESDTIMAFDLQTAPDKLLQPVPQQVRRVLDPAGIDDVMMVENTVWGEDMNWLGDRLRQQLRETPDYVSVYVAYADERPVSSAWITFHKGHFAGLWGGSTLEQYRGQGWYTALLAARMQEARSRGVRYLTIDASPMSRPIVEKFGFQVITTATECVWHAKTTRT
jgi:GNAT superfamily N-acetyltransferase